MSVHCVLRYKVQFSSVVFRLEKLYSVEIYIGSTYNYWKIKIDCIVLNRITGPVIEICSYWGTQLSRCQFEPWERKQSRFSKRCVFGIWNSGWKMKFRTPVILSVIQRLLNPWGSNWDFVVSYTQKNWYTKLSFTWGKRGWNQVGGFWG
jgi:hypothetical protein